MKTEKLGFLSKQFSSYEITFSKEGDLAEIINPFSCENIRVKYIPDDDFTPYMICFAFQHCCMSDEEDIIKYINDIIEGNRFSIEFFRDGTRCFGGDITAEEISEKCKSPSRLTNNILDKLLEIGVISATISQIDEREIAFQPAVDIQLITVNYLMSKIDKNGSEDFMIDTQGTFHKHWKALVDNRMYIYESDKDVLLRDL